jgi:hypothetical protein
MVLSIAFLLFLHGDFAYYKHGFFASVEEESKKPNFFFFQSATYRT